MPKEKIDSIETLAIFTAEEFDALRAETRQGFQEMREGFRSVTETLNAVLHDVRQIRITDLEKRVE